jgi:hypothetical protein
MTSQQEGTPIESDLVITSQEEGTPIESDVVVTSQEEGTPIESEVVQQHRSIDLSEEQLAAVDHFFTLPMEIRNHIVNGKSNQDATLKPAPVPCSKPKPASKPAPVPVPNQH